MVKVQATYIGKRFLRLVGKSEPMLCVEFVSVGNGEDPYRFKVDALRGKHFEVGAVYEFESPKEGSFNFGTAVRLRAHAKQEQINEWCLLTTAALEASKTHREEVKLGDVRARAEEIIINPIKRAMWQVPREQQPAFKAWLIRQIAGM